MKTVWKLPEIWTLQFTIPLYRENLYKLPEIRQSLNILTPVLINLWIHRLVHLCFLIFLKRLILSVLRTFSQKYLHHKSFLWCCLYQIKVIISNLISIKYLSKPILTIKMVLKLMIYHCVIILDPNRTPNFVHLIPLYRSQWKSCLSMKSTRYSTKAIICTA